MSGKTIDVRDEDFKKTVLDSAPPVLVDFWAPWCGPCKALAPAIEAIASDMAGRLTVAKVDIDTNARTAATYAIRSVPTLMIFKEGKPTATKTGAISRSELRDWIAKET